MYCASFLRIIWIINNSLDFIRSLEEKQLSLTHVSTWDFSTLYTSLPHARLKNQLRDLLERVFHTKGKSFIATNYFRTFWTNDRMSMRYTYFSCRELCLAINFLIDNIYVRFGSSVFRQVIGIPMGSNSAPLLADLFLHTFEYDFMVKTMKHDITKAIQFSNTFRYMDDLLSINNVDFGHYISAIYPPELQLTDTSTSSTEVCYLDTHIKTGGTNTPFRISIYDKRDDFTFRIVNFPHMDSNIPANPAYGVYISQLVRYARICTSKVDFMNRLRRLSLRLRQQGFLTNHFSEHLLNSSIGMFLSSGSMVQPCGRWDLPSRLEWPHRILTLLTCLLLRLFFQLYLGARARAILFCARALFVSLVDVRFGSLNNVLILLCIIFLTHIYVLSVTVLTLWVAPPEMFCNWYRI